MTAGGGGKWNGYQWLNCPSNAVCRESDAALVSYSSSNYEYGYIAMPLWADPDSGTIDVFDRFVIDAEFNINVNLNAGIRVDKVGQVSGWTYGPVSHTCVDKTAASWGRYVHYWCQFRAEVGARSGDSGAPVLLWYDGAYPGSGFNPYDAMIVGILWLREGDYMYFSDWYDIAADFNDGDFEAVAVGAGGGGSSGEPPPEEECEPVPPAIICDP